MDEIYRVANEIVTEGDVEGMKTTRVSLKSEPMRQGNGRVFKISLELKVYWFLEVGEDQVEKVARRLARRALMDALKSIMTEEDQAKADESWKEWDKTNGPY